MDGAISSIIGGNHHHHPPTSVAVCSHCATWDGALVCMTGMTLGVPPADAVVATGGGARAFGAMSPSASPTPIDEPVWRGRD